MTSTNSKPKHSKIKQAGLEFFAATTASAFSKTLVAPLDRLKLLSQVQNELIRTDKLKGQWSGYQDMFSKTVRFQGGSSFWRGNYTNIMRYTIQNGIGLTAKDQIHRIDPLSFTSFGKSGKNFVYGGCGGVVGVLVSYPLEYARSRLANDIKTGKQFNGIFHALKVAHQNEGFRGIYKGISISIPTIFVYRALIFGGYDTFSEYLDDKNNNGGSESSSSIVTGFKKFLGGYLIAAFAGATVYPFDTMRQRMIVTTGESKGYNSWAHQLTMIVKKEGVSALYKGLSMNLLRNVGTAMAVFSYDHVKKVIV